MKKVYLSVQAKAVNEVAIFPNFLVIFWHEWRWKITFFMEIPIFIDTDKTSSHKHLQLLKIFLCVYGIHLCKIGELYRKQIFCPKDVNSIFSQGTWRDCFFLPPKSFLLPHRYQPHISFSSHLLHNTLNNDSRRHLTYNTHGLNSLRLSLWSKEMLQLVLRTPNWA